MVDWCCFGGVAAVLLLHNVMVVAFIAVAVAAVDGGAVGWLVGWLVIVVGYCGWLLLLVG